MFKQVGKIKYFAARTATLLGCVLLYLLLFLQPVCASSRASGSIGIGLQVAPRPPGDITNLEAQPGVNPGEVALEWTAVSDGYGNKLQGDMVYRVYVSTVSDDDFSDSIDWWDNASIEEIRDLAEAEVPGSTESVTITDLEPGTTYYAGIRAYDQNFRLLSEDLNIASSLAFIRQEPILSTLEVIEKSSATAVLRGNLTDLGKYASVDIYFTYWLNDPDLSTSTVKETVSDPTEFSEGIVGLSPDSLYSFTARADYGTDTLAGGTVTFRTYQAPPVKVGEGHPEYGKYRPEATDSSITIKWKGISGHTYRVERDGNFLENVTASSMVTYTDTGLNPDTVYVYRIFSLNSDGEYDADSYIQISAATSPPEDFKPLRRFITPSNRQIEFGGLAKEVLITDVRGREVAEIKGSPVIFDVDRDVKGTLESGIYIYMITTTGGDKEYGTISVVK